MAADAEEFDPSSWHDCHVWRIALDVGEPDENDWTSDLVLDLDVIVEWLCGVDRRTQFRVAPATLVFHGVCGLALHADLGPPDGAVALHEMVIDRTDREQIRDQKVFLGQPYFDWTIRFAWPTGALLRFGAVGYTQTLHGEPLLTDSQKLSRSQRASFGRP